jgi:hypothetical protein
LKDCQTGPFDCDERTEVLTHARRSRLLMGDHTFEKCFGALVSFQQSLQFLAGFWG